MPPGSIESRTLVSRLCTFHWHHTASRRILFYVQHGVRPQGRKLSTHSSPPLIASQTLWKRAAFGLGLYWRALERGFRNRPCRVSLQRAERVLAAGSGSFPGRGSQEAWRRRFPDWRSADRGSSVPPTDGSARVLDLEARRRQRRWYWN